METVFDFNPTNEELASLFGSPEAAKQGPSENPDAEVESIVWLLIRREDWAKAEKYAKKAENRLLETNLLGIIDRARLGLD